MLNPSPVELLEGIAEALAADVAPALAPGPAADQLAAAVAMLRRIARVLGAFPTYLLEDLAELRSALLPAGRGFSELSSGTADAPDPEVLASLPATLPALDTLIGWDLQLREILADRCRTAAGNEEALLDLVRSLNRREATLRLSPWER